MLMDKDLVQMNTNTNTNTNTNDTNNNDNDNKTDHHQKDAYEESDNVSDITYSQTFTFGN